mmetsp:Transcript_25300/g.30913  ORF Transcript_25300/g.30913 Transcript_25300/m.30913 type:complete len:480 (-) Transcript_25300:1616-3055(-)
MCNRVGVRSNHRVTPGSFDGCGISSSEINLRVMPVMNGLGIRTQADLCRFSLDSRLQGMAEVDYALPVVYIETIVEKYAPEGLKKKIITWCVLVLLLGFLFGVMFLNIFGMRNMDIINVDEISHVYTSTSTIDSELSSLFIGYNRISNSRYNKSNCDDIEIDIHSQRYHKLPASEEGYVIMKHTFGQLNNKLQEMSNLFFIAHILNRTLIVEREISGVYDYEKWQAAIPHVSYRVVTPVSRELKMSYASYGYVLVPKENKLLLSTGGRAKLREILKEKRFVSINAEFLFYFREIKETGYSAFLRSFFSNLWPKPHVLKKVEKYIEDSFGNTPYAAVHLRDLEGSCPPRMRRVQYNGYTCSPNKKSSTHIFQSLLPDAQQLPWFVASDHQNKYATNSYLPEGLFFKGYCMSKSHECALIDFEISARANFFIGVYASSASRTIAKMREYRQTRLGIFYPSILHWDVNHTWNNFNSSWLNSV